MSSNSIREQNLLTFLNGARARNKGPSFNDALSRRPDYEIGHVTTLSSPIEELICVAYPRDPQCAALFHALGS